jgi:hypothetical protein
MALSVCSISVVSAGVIYLRAAGGESLLSDGRAAGARKPTLLYQIDNDGR